MPAIWGLIGALLKGVSGMVSEWLKQKRETQLLLSGAKLEEIKLMYGGVDKPTPNIEWVRRALVLFIFSVLSFGMIYGLLWYPELKYTIMIDKEPSYLMGLLFGQTYKGTITLSFISLFYEYVNFGAMICGFYLMKVNTSK